MELAEEGTEADVDVLPCRTPEDLAAVKELVAVMGYSGFSVVSDVACVKKAVRGAGGARGGGGRGGGRSWRKARADRSRDVQIFSE